jgi:hypothetical protein
MNTKTIVSVILITLGIVVLAYSGISFTTPGKPIEFLTAQAAGSSLGLVLCDDHVVFNIATDISRK